MTTKNIAAPTSSSPIVLQYNRSAAGSGTVRGNYVASGATNEGGPIASTVTLDGLIDTLVASVTGYTPAAGDTLQVIADMIGLSANVSLSGSNVTISMLLSQAKFTAGMRTAATNAIGQALTDGLSTAMGF
jgi:LysM repeat protein